MRKLLSYSLLVYLSSVVMGHAQTQSWVPSTNGLLDTYQQPYSFTPSFGTFDINFKTNGPFGKDYIYGHWLDSDSLFRCVAIRNNGKWQSLPFHVDADSWTGDIVQYVDTMYIGGWFYQTIRDKDSAVLPTTSLLKFYNDSVWAAPYYFRQMIYDFAVSGDSLLVWTDAYWGPADSIPTHILTTDGGQTWQYPYSIVHPTDTVANFGIWRHIMFWKGDIITLNHNGWGDYQGVIRWDGTQWHHYGDGIRGTYSSASDIAIFRNELYMAGSFSKTESPLNPGEYITRWDGTKWNDVGGGIQTSIYSMFEYDSLLYCHGYGSGYGDAPIPYLAAWDGSQWCGTPIHYPYGYNPAHFGFVNDTLWMVFESPTTTTTGDPISYINYFDGDYLHGPNAICSTPGLGEEEVKVQQDATENIPQSHSRQGDGFSAGKKKDQPFKGL